MHVLCDDLNLNLSDQQFPGSLVLLRRWVLETFYIDHIRIQWSHTHTVVSILSNISMAGDSQSRCGHSQTTTRDVVLKSLKPRFPFRT